MRNHELVGQVSLDQLGVIPITIAEGDEESLRHHSGDHVNDESESETEVKVHSMQEMKEADVKREQEAQEQERVLFLTDAAFVHGAENFDKRKNVDVQNEDSIVPEMHRGNQAQHTLRDGEVGSVAFTQPKEEETGWRSLACDKKLSSTNTPHIKAPQDDLHLNLELDDTDQDKTAKMEQDNETNAVDKVLGELQLDEQGSIFLANNSKNPVNKDKVEFVKKENHTQKSYVSPEVERELLTSVHSCALKMGHKGNPGVSFASCKEEVQNNKNREEELNSDRQTPEPKNAVSKEEMCPLESCKEDTEEDTGHLELKLENQHKVQEGEEIRRIEEADHPHAYRGETLN